MEGVNSRRVGLALAAFGVAAAVGLGVHGGIASAQRGGDTSLKDLGSVSGTVTAPKAFKAAHVYLRNIDKHILYMVYTSGGNFRAVALFPGNYEVVVKGRGLESDTQKITVKAGENPGVKVALKNAADPEAYPSSVDPALARTANGILAPKPAIKYGTYDEVYPPGSGREVLETLCMKCHGENFFSMRPRSAAGWKAGIEYMLGKNLIDKDKGNFGEGTLANPTSFRFGLQDRKDLLEYLSKNFGLDKKPQAVKVDKEIPLDEAQLAKAQYVEYYVLGGEEGTTTAVASDSEAASDGVAGVRIVMQVQIDAQGNRWAVDRGVPSRLVRLDPRTGEQKAWDLPDKRAGVHEVILDRQGTVWVPEFNRQDDEKGAATGSGAGSKLTSRLLGFNPKTEKWEHVVDLDPNNVIRAERKGPLMAATVDSRGAIYANWMITGAIGKYDPTTKKAQTFLIPTPGAVPYGQTIDPFDNVWVSEWNGGKLGRFNTKTNTWTEFIPPDYPVNFRRGPNSDAEGNIWTGVWSAGKIPGKIMKLDQKTGNWTVWDIPFRGAQPYEASIDREGNIWFPETSQPNRPQAIGRLNPKDGSFVFYPRPQFVADSTRVNHASDGSVHYTARYGAAKDTSAFGVLYPDKDKIASLAPMMLNGAPGYPFKPGTPARGNQ